MKEEREGREGERGEGRECLSIPFPFIALSIFHILGVTTIPSLPPFFLLSLPPSGYGRHPTVVPPQHISFKDLVEIFCEKHGVLFLPKPGRTEHGRQVGEGGGRREEGR